MSNVKPGDFARINYPAAKDHGKVVHVNEQYVFTPARYRRAYGELWWVCTMMSSIRAMQINGDRNSKRLASPGAVLVMPDICLQRIDPPAEDEVQETQHEVTA